jgi:hypothetical protein
MLFWFANWNGCLAHKLGWSDFENILILMKTT